METAKREESVWEAVARALSQEGVPRGFRRMVVGCSGGGDSTALARVIHRLFPRAALLLVRVDHSLPEAESPRDYEAVQSLANELGAAAVEICVDVRRAMNETGESLEMAARRLRHQALQDAATLFEADAIALGHNADDQVETMLLRLARGTSATGLAAMAVWVPGTAGKTGLFRPLLGCSREVLRDWLRKEQCTWREDPTNGTDDVLRNRLRNQVLPRLYEALGPEARQGFLRTASLLQSEEREWLMPMVEEAERGCVDAEEGFLFVQALQRFEAPLRRRILLRAALRAGVPAAVLSGEKVRQMEALASTEGKGTQGLDLGCGYRAVREYDALRIVQGKEGAPGAESVSTLRVEADIGYEKTPRTDLLRRPLTAWISRAKVPDAAQLRVRRMEEGDRLRPMGTAGHTKLSDILIDRKVALLKRPSVEVVCLGTRVVWLPGHGVDSSFAVEAEDAPSWRLTVE